jgi:flagellar biosynthesis protein FlgN
MNSPASTLASERQLLATLTELLQEEQRVLVAADADSVATITPRKIQLVQQLAAQAAIRHRALGAAGFESAEAGMEPWLAAQNSTDVRAEWEQLLDATREAKELNRINGMLINKQLAYNQQKLAELGTDAPGGNAAVYGPGGLTIGAGPSKRFVIG